MADTKNQQIHIFACIHHKKKKNGCKKSVLGPRKPTNTLNWIVKHVKDFMIIITNVYIIMNVITLYSFRLLHCPCVFQDVLHIISTMMSIWGHLCTAYKHNVGHWASNCVQYIISIYIQWNLVTRNIMGPVNSVPYIKYSLYHEEIRCKNADWGFQLCSL